MHFHPSTFDYYKPNEAQEATMAQVRAATKLYAETLDRLLPEGTDKYHCLREVRDVGMWALVSVTRHADGSPRTHENP